LEKLREEEATQSDVLEAGKKFFGIVCSEKGNMKQARYNFFMKRKMSPALKMLPPTDQNLFLHTLHAYLHVLLWKTADKNMPPEKAHKITKYGWEITDDNVAMPVISSLPVAPPKLFDSF